MGLAAAAQAQTGADPRPAINALLAKFADAYNRKDAAGIAALFAQDAILAPPGPIVAGRQAVEQDYRKRLDAGFSDLRLEPQHVQAMGDGAWAVGHFTAKHIEGGSPRERRGNFTTVFQRQGDGLVIRAHSFGLIG